jgi:hypothetical protein
VRRVEAHDLALEQAQARRATVVFLASLEQRLVADADSEKRLARPDGFRRRREQILLLPGRTMAWAFFRAAGVRTTCTSAPTASRALWTLRKLPES